MKHIKLKYVPNIKKYTVVDIRGKNAISNINTYPINHPSHKWGHMSMYISLDRIAELTPIANKQGYTFIIQ